MIKYSLPYKSHRIEFDLNLIFKMIFEFILTIIISSTRQHVIETPLDVHSSKFYVLNFQSSA